MKRLTQRQRSKAFRRLNDMIDAWADEALTYFVLVDGVFVAATLTDTQKKEAPLS